AHHHDVIEADPRRSRRGLRGLHYVRHGVGWSAAAQSSDARGTVSTRGNATHTAPGNNAPRLRQTRPGEDVRGQRVPSMLRASVGVATWSPRISTILAAFSTSAALLGASWPRPR